MWTSLAVINCLKVALAPYLPFSSARLHGLLGLEGSPEEEGWRWDPYGLKPGQALSRPEPLFAKLEEEVAEAEVQRIAERGEDD